MQNAKFFRVLSAIAACLVAGLEVQCPVRAEESQRNPVQLAQLYVGERRMMTTYGQGRANAPADLAEIRLYINSADPSAPYPAEATEEPPSPPELLTKEKLQPIVDALVKAGIAASNIRIEEESSSPAYSYGPPGTGYVIVKLERPTQTIVDTIKRVAGDAANETGLFYSSADALCKLNDQTQLEDRARALAIADVRKRIDSMAAAAGVRATQVLNVVEFYGYPSPSDYTSCTPAEEATSASPEVSVTIFVLMTYAIE